MSKDYVFKFNMIKYKQKDWCSMQDKLKKLFNEIKVEESILEQFADASIEKIILYDKNKIIEFLINTKNIIPIDTYYAVLEKLQIYFNSFEVIKLIIIPSSIDYSLLKEYYLHIMKQVCLDRNKYQIFMEREIEINNNVITIKAYNKIECTNLIQLKQELIDKLMYFGFKIELNIDLVLEGDKELKDKIEAKKQRELDRFIIKANKTCPNSQIK